MVDLSKTGSFICLLMIVVSIQALNITVVGTGYVGLVTAAGLAELGHNVIGVDIDQAKIQALQQGIIPIFEPDLSDLVIKSNRAGYLVFTTDIQQAVENASVIFVAVGTPMAEDGSADLSALYAVVDSIVRYLNGPKIICIKSTVPIGTCANVQSMIEARNLTYKITIVSNPEFLREGSAVRDFFNPDRIVIGCNQAAGFTVMKQVYQRFADSNIPFLYTNTASSETIKYASNAFLALKISYINEMAQLCERTGANIMQVASGMGLDKRISPHFLQAGPGFGGSCFPKDVMALLKKSEEMGVPLKTVITTLSVNEQQKNWIIQKISTLLDNKVQGKTIGILGLAFKANTDDIRESPAVAIIQKLLPYGATIQAFDPQAIENTRKVLPSIQYMESIGEVATDADILIILTEWQQFKTLPIEQLKKVMKKPCILDARNILDAAVLRAHGFVVDNIGNA